MKYVFLLALQFIFAMAAFASEPLSEKEKVMLHSTKLIVDNMVYMKDLCSQSYPKADIEYDKTIAHLENLAGEEAVNLKSEEYEIQRNAFIASMETMMKKAMATEDFGLTLCRKMFENGLKMTAEKVSHIRQKAYAQYLSRTGASTAEEADVGSAVEK
ncbi:MAG TPA: hypothetical protein VF268_16340 [Gammaproteobacteria bacterium]